MCVLGAASGLIVATLVEANARLMTKLPTDGRRHDVSGSGIGSAIGLAFVCAMVALLTVPAGLEGGKPVALQGDPPALAEHKRGLSVHAPVAQARVRAALRARQRDPRVRL